MKSDFLLVHSPVDLQRAYDLCKLIENYGYTCRVYDNLSCLENDCVKVRYVMLCVSQSFDNSTFLAAKQVVTQKWLSNRLAFRIHVVHFDQPILIKDPIVRSHFHGLMQFTNFYLSSTRFEKDLKKEYEKYKNWGLQIR